MNNQLTKIPNRTWPTTPATRQRANSQRPTGFLVMSALAMWTSISTGGQLDENFLKRHHNYGYAYPGMEDFRPPLAIHVRTSIEKLTHIRDVFKTSTSALANVFQVSRQTFYNWLKGENINDENLAKINDLDIAATHLTAANITNSQAINRVITDGKNLLALVESGHSALQAADQLIALLQHESLQREHLNKRLDGVKSRAHDHDDTGAPFYDDTV